MNFNSNPILYPKDDGLKPTKDNGLNPPCYPKEEGLNPFKAIVERINALESVTRNYGDSFETKQLTVSENAQIENLNATEGTVNRLNSTNATVTNLNSTNATVINADIENAQIKNLNATEGTVNTLNSTTSTVTNLNSTNGNIKNAEVENLHATEGTVDTLESTTSTVTNGNIKNAKVENLNVTKNAQIKNLNATEGTVDTLNSTNCNIKNADIENLHTNKLTWDLPNIDVINAEVKKLNVTTEIKVENLKTEEPTLSNAVVGYDENGKMIPIKIAELANKVDKDLANATGTLAVANGGTGATTAKEAEYNIVVPTQNDTIDAESISDESRWTGTYVSPSKTTGRLYTKKFNVVWEYIKGKISSVLGLTKDNYGGKANTAGTADYAKRLKTFASYNNPFVYDATNGMRYYVFKIAMSSYFNSILVQIYDDINYGFSRKYILGLWHRNDNGYNVSVTDLGGTKYNGLRVWLGNDGNVYLQADIRWGSRISFSYLEDITDIKVEKIGTSKIGSNKDIDGNVLFTPLTDPIIDCGAIRGASDLSSASITDQHLKANITGNVSGSSGSCTGKSAQAGFLDEYTSTRPTSLNIVPKDSSEYGGMRKDVVTDSVTDGSHPGQDGHLLTMFWDNSGRYDSQLFVSNSTPLTLKARYKANTTDYGAWTDIITSNNIGFDYIVDSQQKFNNLLSILKSGTPNTYRSIGIVGGLGDGEYGEYLYTVDSNSSDANLNNASLIGLNNPKIVITANNANAVNIFKNGLIKDIDFNIGGTVNAGKTVTLFHNCTYNNGKIALNNVSANFNIVNTTLSNVVNDECKSFIGCTLNDCETIQSAFTNCYSEMLYVSTDTNIANKYSFNKCGIHLDMKKANMTQLETVTINIASMTDSKLTVLDTSSKLKNIILNVDASDSLSEIVGNNDKKYSIYEPFVKRVSKSVSPSMRSKAYLCYYDESHTPIFSNDGVKFYLDEAMTQQIYCYSITNSNSERIFGFSLANDDTHLYSSLTLNKEITYSQRDGESVASLKLSDFGDEFILNGNSLKTYICRNDESGTLLYSNNNGTNIYISPYINDDNKVQYANPNTNSKLFMVGQFSYITKNLGAFNVRPSFSDLNFATPQLLEVIASKDNYAVQVVSNYDVPIYVENAFSTKVKNG